MMCRLEGGEILGVRTDQHISFERRRRSKAGRKGLDRLVVAESEMNFAGIEKVTGGGA